MSTQRYSVTPHAIETLLTWVKSGEIAIPEIQRPFVWEATKVRNLLDSLYQGYPVGYLIAWRNPTVRLKDGTPSAGKRILIDGQQRVTALMAALLGREVLTEDYVFDSVAGRQEGRDAVVAAVATALAGATTVHHGHEPVITFTGPDRALGAWPMNSVVELPAAQGSIVRRGWSRYDDEYVRTDAGWRLRRCVLTPLAIEEPS